MRKVGDKEAVYYGEAEHTAGGLRRSDLMINAKGKIVSKAQHAAGKEKAKNLKHTQGGSFRSFLERANPAPRGGRWFSKIHVGGADGGNIFSDIFHYTPQQIAQQRANFKLYGHSRAPPGKPQAPLGGYLFSHNPGQSLEHRWLVEEAR